MDGDSDPNVWGRYVAGVLGVTTNIVITPTDADGQSDIFRTFFRDFDVLLAPVTITPAFPHSSDQVPLLKRTLLVNGTAVPYLYLPVYAGVAAYSGLPATAFPWGRTHRGLPIGLQAIGPYLEDRTTIAFASLLEREFGGFTPPPDYR